MASTRTHDLVATVGKYKDGNGEEKKRYLNVGSAFTDDQGRISLKLEAMPVTPEWSGWLSLYPVERQEQRRPAAEQQRPAQRRPAAQQDEFGDGPTTGAPEDDDIPF